MSTGCQAISLTELFPSQNSKIIKTQGLWLVLSSISSCLEGPDETLALVYEIFHHIRYIGILYFAANDCFMTKWLCEYSFVSLIADSSLAFLDIRISVLMVSTRLEFTTNLQTLIVACCIHLRIQHMSRVLLLFRSFPDFVVNVMTTLIFPTNVPVFR